MHWGKFCNGVVLGGIIMLELTQEQLDQMLSDAKKGLFTEEELNKRVVSETDRRVESGIQKGLETHKQKWEQELSERAKLSAEELARKDFEDKLKEVSIKEAEINRRANQLEAKTMLADAEIPKSHYDKFTNMLVTDDAELTKSNVQNFIEMFNSTKTEIETKVKSEFSNVPPPKTTTGSGTVNKADFDKMGYAEKIEFKNKYPEIYKNFMK